MSEQRSALKSLDALNKTIRIAFVVADFNAVYTTQLERDNQYFLESHGFSSITTYHVPGSFEIPGFVNKLILLGEYDLIITLGVVIRGATPHFDYVCSETSRAIMDLTVAQETPIIFGILTCNTEEQVRERMGPHFAIAGLNLLVELQRLKSSFVV